MKLRIDTGDIVATKVILYKGNMVIGEVVKEREKRSQVVLEAILEVLELQELKLTDVDELEVHPGPGSYTGIRVGVSVANTLQFLLGIPLNGALKPVEPLYE
jgi:tRNA threonylcarbamoyladenosine biosynthesis protein TsaB